MAKNGTTATATGGKGGGTKPVTGSTSTVRLGKEKCPPKIGKQK